MSRLRDHYAQGFGEGEWPDEQLEVHAPRLVSIITRLPEGPEIARAIVSETYGSNTGSAKTRKPPRSSDLPYKSCCGSAAKRNPNHLQPQGTNRINR